MYVYHSACVKVSGKFGDSLFSLPTMWVSGLNLGHEVWEQVLLPAEPLSHFLAFGGGILSTEAPDNLLASQRLLRFLLIAASFILLITLPPRRPLPHFLKVSLVKLPIFINWCKDKTQGFTQAR